MKDFRYRLMPDQAGVFAEIYLPKRSHLQGVLYDTLTAGFKIDYVKEHFRQKRLEVAAYIENAKKYWDVTREIQPAESDFLYDTVIDQLPDLFYGYSMYEVDGVFRSEDSATGIDEERTQVLRLMFRFDLDELWTGLDFVSKDLEFAELISRGYLRSHHWSTEKFMEELLATHPRKNPFAADEVRAILDRVADHARYIGLFVFGYVVFEICSEIRRLSLAQIIQAEKEIWVTFLWNLVINRIEKADLA